MHNRDDEVEQLARMLATTAGLDPDKTIIVDGEHLSSWRLYSEQAHQMLKLGTALRLPPKR